MFDLSISHFYFTPLCIDILINDNGSICYLLSNLEKYNYINDSEWEKKKVQLALVYRT